MLPGLQGYTVTLATVDEVIFSMTMEFILQRKLEVNFKTLEILHHLIYLFLLRKGFLLLHIRFCVR